MSVPLCCCGTGLSVGIVRFFPIPHNTNPDWSLWVKSTLIAALTPRCLDTGGEREETGCVKWWKLRASMLLNRLAHCVIEYSRDREGPRTIRPRSGSHTRAQHIRKDLPKLRLIRTKQSYEHHGGSRPHDSITRRPYDLLQRIMRAVHDCEAAP